MPSENFRSIDEIKVILATVKEAGLNVPDKFWDIPVETIQDAYNGIGADWQSNISRSAITYIRGFFEPVALVHDVVGDLYNDGTEQGLEAWNEKFWLENGVKLIEYSYSWYNPMRFIQKRRNLALYGFLKAFGSIAWKNAYKKKEESKDGN